MYMFLNQIIFFDVTLFIWYFLYLTQFMFVFSLFPYISPWQAISEQVLKKLIILCHQAIPACLIVLIWYS